MSELANSIFRILESHADPEKAKSMKSYMKNHFDFFGVTSPVRKNACKEVIASTRMLSNDDLIKLIDLLWHHDCRESQYVGLDILIKNKKRLNGSDMDQIVAWVTTKSWWDTVDALASHITGILFEKNPNLIPFYTEAWLRSENIWLNRNCLLYQLKYGDKTNFEFLMNYILLLKYKNEFFIQKAIGWSLRQYSKYDAAKVLEFVGNTDLSNLASREAVKLIK